jgi:hypothetical protein
MKGISMRYIIIILLALLIASCSNDNQVTIKNIAQGSVFVNFRAKTHLIVPGESATITDIPNGTYDYSTTYELPAGLKGQVDGEAASGTLIFEDKSTKINFIYSSMRTDSTYTLGCTKSSTRSLATTTTTSP